MIRLTKANRKLKREREKKKKRTSPGCEIWVLMMTSALVGASLLLSMLCTCNVEQTVTTSITRGKSLFVFLYIAFCVIGCASCFCRKWQRPFFFSCLLLWGGVGGWAFRLVHCLSFTSLSLLKLSFAVFLQIFFFLAFYLAQFLSREFAYISSIYLLFFLALNQSVLLYVVASDQPNKQTKKKKENTETHTSPFWQLHLIG